MAKIQYENKVALLENADIPDINKVKADDMNEIKQVVNANADLLKSNQDIINLIYPVGAIYMSFNNTSPATLFGGTWEQIKDKFILSAGDTYSAGATGGSASHKLTSAELPKHTHAYAKPNANTNSHVLTINEIPSHEHNGLKVDGTALGLKNNTLSGLSFDYFGSSRGSNVQTNPVGGGQGHSHGIGTTSTASGDGGFANNSFSTLPPYLAVYIWKRTA